MLSTRAWGLEVHLLNSIRGAKGLDPDPVWELGLAHGHCGNKMILHAASVSCSCS